MRLRNRVGALIVLRGAAATSTAWFHWPRNGVATLSGDIQYRAEVRRVMATSGGVLAVTTPARLRCRRDGTGDSLQRTLELAAQYWILNTALKFNDDIARWLGYLQLHNCDYLYAAYPLYPPLRAGYRRRSYFADRD